MSGIEIMHMQVPSTLHDERTQICMFYDTTSLNARKRKNGMHNPNTTEQIREMRYTRISQLTIYASSMVSTLKTVSKQEEHVTWLNELNPRKSVLFERPPIHNLLKNIPKSSGNRKCSAVIKRVFHGFPFYASHFSPYHIISDPS